MQSVINYFSLVSKLSFIDQSKMNKQKGSSKGCHVPVYDAMYSFGESILHLYNRSKGSWLLTTNLIPGCIGKRIRLGSESSSGAGACGGGAGGGGWNLGICISALKKQANNIVGRQKLLTLLRPIYDDFPRAEQFNIQSFLPIFLGGPRGSPYCHHPWWPTRWQSSIMFAVDRACPQMRVLVASMTVECLYFTMPIAPPRVDSSIGCLLATKEHRQFMEKWSEVVPEKDISFVLSY